VNLNLRGIANIYMLQCTICFGSPTENSIGMMIPIFLMCHLYTLNSVFCFCFETVFI